MAKASADSQSAELEQVKAELQADLAVASASLEGTKKDLQDAQAQLGRMQAAATREQNNQARRIARLESECEDVSRLYMAVARQWREHQSSVVPRGFPDWPADLGKPRAEDGQRDADSTAKVKLLEQELDTLKKRMQKMTGYTD